jgi:hypothetical protein
MIRQGDYASVIRGTEKGRVVKIEGKTVFLDVDGFEMPFNLSEVIRIHQPGGKGNQSADAPSFTETLNIKELEVNNACIGFRLLENAGEQKFQLHVINPLAFKLHCRIFEEKNNHWVLLYQTTLNDRNYDEGPAIPQNELLRIDHLLIQFLFYPVKVHEPCPLPWHEESHGLGKKFLKGGAFKQHVNMKFYVLKNIDFQQKELLNPISAKESDLPKPNVLSAPVGMKEDEIDLHIEELIDNIAGMSNHDMLQTQLRACRKKLNNV